MTDAETISPEQIENIKKILEMPIETDEDYAALGEMVEDESKEEAQDGLNIGAVEC